MTDTKAQPAPRPGVLSLSIKEKTALYAAYMPFLKGGGMFIPTTKVFRPGDDVFMLVSLMDDPIKLPITGRVVWVTPAGTQGNKVPGIGVQFNSDEAGLAARNKIENLLGGQLQSTKPTHTM